MNYRHVYMCIIMHAKLEENLGIRKRHNGNYYERHHILPKSLFPLWAKKHSNVVLLIAREHFFCHQLLTKIYPSDKMFFALHAFVSRPNFDYHITSREYERIKLEWSKKMKNNKPNLGRHWSEETKKKISEGTKRGMKNMGPEKYSLWRKRHKEGIIKSMSNRIKKPKKEKVLLTKEQLAESRRKKVEKQCKKVMNVETGEIFKSVKEARKKYGEYSRISRAALYGKKSRGYHWKYI